MQQSRNFIVIIGLLSAGCDSSSSSQSSTIPVAKALPAGETSNTASSPLQKSEPSERLIGGIKFEIPAGWEEKTLSSTVLLAEYVVPDDAGAGRLTFSTAGGGTTANLDRWKSQFRPGATDPEPKETQLTVAGKDATLIELHGTFADSFGGGGPKPNWELLGVAIPIGAEHNYFVKLTGPKKTITAKREEFLKLLQTARLE